MKYWTTHSLAGGKGIVFEETGRRAFRVMMPDSVPLCPMPCVLRGEREAGNGRGRV